MKVVVVTIIMNNTLTHNLYLKLNILICMVTHHILMKWNNTHPVPTLPLICTHTLIIMNILLYVEILIVNNAHLLQHHSMKKILEIPLTLIKKDKLLLCINSLIVVVKKLKAKI